MSYYIKEKCVVTVALIIISQLYFSDLPMKENYGQKKKNFKLSSYS